ncbi:MAG: PorT family protein [Flavobacteriales bacterium]|nr:PorT family protein [Flavobacteriales bacterium]
MYSIKKIIPVLLFSCVASMAIAQQDSTKVNPKLTAKVGWNLPEIYNQGFELNVNYFLLRKSWVRIGPGVQLMYFFTPYKEWFPTSNVEKSLISEGHFNLIMNIEFIPAKRNTFYIGISPFVGYQLINNKGSVTNTERGDFDLEWNYNVHRLQWGPRIELGGYLGKKKRFGLEGHFQFSLDGITDNDPRSKALNIGLQDYKSFIGLSAIYRIK